MIESIDVVLSELCAEIERREEDDEQKEPIALLDVNDDTENDAELDTDSLSVAK